MNRICTQPGPRSCSAVGCSGGFEITQEDLEFYDKVSPVFNGKKELIPPPTLCPDCRVQRRMTWRNDRTFYHRKCDKTGKMFISMYAPDTKFPVYKQDVWHGDSWEGLDFGRAYDFSRSFFAQWGELRDSVPHWGVAITNCENSDYCNYCTDEKNCYLDIAAEGNENCYFDLFTKESTNCVDCTFAYQSTLCHECIQVYQCYALKSCMYMEDCSDCAFCFDCKGCKNCLLSTNLRNKEYCVMNEQYTKEEYERKLKELALDRASSQQQIKEIWKNIRIQKGIYRDMYLMNCEECLGNDIKNSKNCTHCFNASGSEDCAYLYDVMNAQDCRDMNYSLYDPEASYEIISTVGTKFCGFLMSGPYNSNCFYGQQLKSCKNCFGCHGLKNKEYCILNKQYTKEGYEELVPKIIDHMRATPLRLPDGNFAGQEWGEFFPSHLSPHGYNETVAQEYMPLTKAEVLQHGWAWADETESNQQYAGPPANVPDSIRDAGDDLIKQVLTCEVSGKLYKILLQELAFYRQMGIPVPRRCPPQRHKDRNTLRNPRTLWKCSCAKCAKEIQTTYAPERPAVRGSEEPSPRARASEPRAGSRREIVYCEECYLQTVY